MDKSYMKHIENLDKDYFTKQIEEFEFSVTNFGQWESHGKYDITNNIMPMHRLIYVTDGEIEYVSEGHTYTLRQHDLIYSPANTPYSAYAKSETEPKFYYIYFQVNPIHLIEKFTKLMACTSSANIYHAKNSKVEYLMLLMFEEYSHKFPGYHYKLHCLLTMILIELLRIRQSYSVTHNSKSEKLPTSVEVINQATALINSKLDTPLKVSQLARVLGVSENYLYKIFKSSLGISPQEYMLQCKIEQAKQMLEYSNKNITQIAAELAFSSSNHFSNLFFQREGIRPKEYRNLHKK